MKIENYTISTLEIPTNDNEIISFFTKEVEFLKTHCEIRNDEKICFELPKECYLNLINRISSHYKKTLKHHLEQILNIKLIIKEDHFI